MTRSMLPSLRLTLCSTTAIFSWMACRCSWNSRFRARVPCSSVPWLLVRSLSCRWMDPALLQHSEATSRLATGPRSSWPNLRQTYLFESSITSPKAQSTPTGLPPGGAISSLLICEFMGLDLFHSHQALPTHMHNEQPPQVIIRPPRPTTGLGLPFEHESSSGPGTKSLSE